MLVGLFGHTPLWPRAAMGCCFPNSGRDDVAARSSMSMPFELSQLEFRSLTALDWELDFWPVQH
jgi:hypothetical protein